MGIWFGDEGEPMPKQRKRSQPSRGVVRARPRDLIDGRAEAAPALLEPLVGRRRYHVSEFAALMLARTEYQTAQTWFDLWAGADPDHPALERWRARIALADWPRRLFGRRRRS
jgi:hypothetical protein